MTSGVERATPGGRKAVLQLFSADNERIKETTGVCGRLSPPVQKKKKHF